ncbi:MAG: multifunctional CCA tRNA nucleotidyl transferase/2'3'-cyclic phosphodiesterase/2'nucleotidase/phosphatase, partial [Algicola sp.]|nr:multifunctional CCA tRNA nucleotidyl transferase/2'3'-cyclic phosphodiesterase/2'nucleotidase/phosphatase [Algicola sp.]
PDMLEPVLLARDADARGRTGFEQRDYPVADYLRQAYAVSVEIVAKPFVEQGYQGIKIREMMQQARIKAIGRLKT